MPQMLQEPSDETRPIWLKMNIAYTKVMVIDNTPINMNNVLIENVEGVSILEEKKNRGALDGVFQTPGSLRKHSCHLPEQAGVQLLCVARYDVWG